MTETDEGTRALKPCTYTTCGSVVLLWAKRCLGSTTEHTHVQGSKLSKRPASHLDPCCSLGTQGVLGMQLELTFWVHFL